MPKRQLPVRPDLTRLEREADELAAALRRGDATALAEWSEFAGRPAQFSASAAADARFVLARSYGAADWERLEVACRLTDAIWNDELERVRSILAARPELLFEDARAVRSNWGPPLSYAANLGRERIVEMLCDLGARDLGYALDRAVLHGELDTARFLHRRLGSPKASHELLGGAAYTLNVDGTAFALEIGAPVRDEHGRRLAPVDVVLETDSRNPAAKRAILELYVAHGLELPDTPTMALHRGRVDLLELHLRRDPQLFARTFAHEEIYPPELGCHDEVQATQGTPLAGTTLLHLCADYDELAIARWMLDRGADPNARAEVDADGFGGHTALFGTIVSQPNFWMNFRGRGPFEAPFAQLLLERGADPNVRASLRKQFHPGYDLGDATHEYRDVTPLAWGERFTAPIFVSRPAMELVRAAGGR